MSDTLPTYTNWTVYYTGDTGGDKQIRWTGTTGTNTVNEIYTDLMTLFDNTNQINNVEDTVPMKAVTPTEYEIGTIDLGDLNAWFIDPESIKHLTGGSINTAGWTRVEGTGTNVGIVKVAVTSNNWTSSDVGHTATDDTNGDTGTILYVDTDEVWIRPDTSDSTDSFDTNSSTISSSGPGTTVTYAAASTTGEMIWSNIFTLGGIVSGSQMYIAQSDALISNTEDSGSGAWWGTDHIDVLILTTDQGTLIDRGFLTVYNRDYLQGYNDFQVDVSAGGRTPVPISTGADDNNTVAQATANGYGVTFDYEIDLEADVGVGGNQPYDCTVSGPAGTLTVQEIYEACKEHTRLGETSAIDTATGDLAIPGEQYKGGQIQLTLTGSTTNYVIGETVTGGTSSATGVVIGSISDGAPPGHSAINLSNVKGTFVDGDVLSGGTGNGTVDTGGVAVIPAKDSPLATFAGGKLFLAQGLFLDSASLDADQSELYELIDNNGVTRTPPIERSFTITGFKAGSEVRMYTDDGLRRETSSTQTPSPGIEDSTEYLDSIADVTLVNAGSGYTNGSETLTLVGGTGTATVLNVTIAGGVVDSIDSINTAGLYTATPSGTIETTSGGTGTGATVSVTFSTTPFLFKYIYDNAPTNGSDLDVYIQVMHLNHPYQRLEATLTDANQSIPVQQTTERNYRNP